MIFVSFNTGLAKGYVKKYTERLPLVIGAIRETEASVLFLQEVWTDEATDMILAKARNRFPYSFRVQTGQERATSRKGEATLFLECASNHCKAASPDDLGPCVLNHCREEFSLLSPECRSCLISKLGKPYMDIRRDCLSCNGKTDRWSYNGRNGLLLLSKNPFLKTEFTLLPSYLVRRAALHVTLTDDSLGEIDIYGTHLTADMGDTPPYGGENNSWKNEHKKQIEAIHQWITQTRAPGNGAVLMGDMNCGPGIGEPGELPEHYQLFPDYGWSIPFAQSPEAKSTFSPSNLLNSPETKNVILDHIMFKNMPAGTGYITKRVYDRAVQASPHSDDIFINISDHFGVWSQTVPNCHR